MKRSNRNEYKTPTTGTIRLEQTTPITIYEYGNTSVEGMSSRISGSTSHKSQTAVS